MGDFKAPFITKCLAEYNADVIATMRLVMKKKKVGITEEGYQSLAYKTFQKGGGAYSNLSFREYLRFVDMGVSKGHPLNGLKAVTVALQAQKKSGKILVKSKFPKKIYSSIAYGKLTHLQNKLLFGYTEEAIAALKEELQNPPGA